MHERVKEEYKDRTGKELSDDEFWIEVTGGDRFFKEIENGKEVAASATDKESVIKKSSKKNSHANRNGARGGDFNVASDTAENAIDNNLLDTVLDVLSLGYSAYELYNAIENGDKDKVIEAAGWLGVDVAATIIPGVPGSWVLKAADKVTDAAKGADKVTDIAKGADKATDASNLSNNRGEIDKVIDYAKKNDGKPLYDNKSTQNTFNNKEKLLPKFDKNGNEITYKEYDISKARVPSDRGLKRVVIGSDGKKYYTNDHYKTFTEIK